MVVLFYIVFSIYLFLFLYTCISLFFANLSCLLESTENNKKRKFVTSDTCCFISYFGMSWSMFVFMFLAFMSR